MKEAERWNGGVTAVRSAGDIFSDDRSNENGITKGNLS